MTPSPSSNKPPDPVRHAAVAALRHNLRTPVNHLLGVCEVLIDDAAEVRNVPELDALRQIHAAARGILNEISESLSNREVVAVAEVEDLYRQTRPRLERIAGCLRALQDKEQIDIPPEWLDDLERIERDVENLRTQVSSSEAEPAEEAQPRQRDQRPAGPRLLVVDDCPTRRSTLRRHLERQGYSVTEAVNGSEALDQVADGEFDLILLDTALPVMDGFEVLERMKHNRKLRNVPVVVTGGADEVPNVITALESGANDFLFEPFEPVLLRARVGALLERRRLAGELTVQAKLASLGSLTAGIAHEIKNPLNFVMNFAEVARDLVAEQGDALGEEGSPAPDVGQLRDITRELGDAIEKIREHGARADSVIRSMLAHSRGQTGERRQTDLNALVREDVRLAFHSMRAQDHTFQVAILEEYDPDAGMVDVIPQDLSRVFLNVASNAFYAIREKARQNLPDYQPILKVSTHSAGGNVEIRIHDNGTGIPDALRGRIFDPFFTTKAAGEGTGLGLSLSYEIVTQEHGGEMRVESEEGNFTEIAISVPRQRAATA